MTKGQTNTALASDLARDLAALAAGDPGPIAALFARAPGQRSAILKALLARPEDAPVARAFRLIWQDKASFGTDQGRNLLRWYLGAEVGQRLAGRRQLHRDLMARLMVEEGLFTGSVGVDLAVTVARLALEHGESLAERAAGGRLLRQLDLAAHPLTQAMVQAAIQAVDLTLLTGMITRWLDEGAAPELKPAMDWAMGLMLEFEGIHPGLERLMERRWRLDPTEPLAAQRQVQIGLHHGLGLAALTGPIDAMRRDPTDPNLAKVLTFAYWQARLIGNDAKADTWRAELVALDKGWSDTMPRPTAAGLDDALPPHADLGQIVAAGQALAQADWRLDGPWQPQNLNRAFQALADAMAQAVLPPDWDLPRLLATAQEFLQTDRREYSWCNHFDASPHATGLPRYGMISLPMIPVLHDGLMLLIAAICRRGLDAFLVGNAPAGLGLVARLLQLHNRAALEIDRSAEVEALIQRLDQTGLIPDVLALERDGLALNRGAAAPDATPPSRQDTQLKPFLPRDAWTAAEAVVWTPLCRDAAVPGRFDAVWPDGRVEVAAHDTPPGQVALARLPGLGLVPEDFVIGPSGHVLRPDPYHTSAEFPWPGPAMAAAGRRAIRLRPATWRRIDEPVLVLEGFEALRWRNFYHWMVPMLSRIALAREQGLLDNRRLVLPQGLSGWMLQSLALLGLRDDQLLTLPVGHGCDFADALLLSSVEHVSPACVLALRRGLLAAAGLPAAGVLQAPADGPALFLSRRGHGLRALVNQDEVEDMAAELGFQVVAPQELDIAGQVRLFASARGVAAVEGAALSNTIFAPPGIAVLALCCENEMMPIFNDLSIILGQHHRKLAGAPRPVPGRGNRLQPPFHVDLGLVRQSLLWVLKTGKVAGADAP